VNRKPLHLRTLLGRLGIILAYGAGGALAALLVATIAILNNKPDLKPWHQVNLGAEFSKENPVHSFAEYLDLENRLFRQLQEQISDQIAPKDAHNLNRYHRGSFSNPERWRQNWNRSYELPVDPHSTQPARSGVLLIHGLSDSPYSLRKIGIRLHRSGAHVLALRLPGHGTAPAALTRTRWQDMAAAVELAMQHLRKRVGKSCPLSIIGYSNGAALTINYVLKSLEHSHSLPQVTGIVLISPQIAVTPLAEFAVWQARLGRVLGLNKLGWQNVGLEYDPFKYSSFPVNGAVIAHQLTNSNRSRLTRLQNSKELKPFPPVLTFQSVVDATVSSSAVVEELFARLPPPEHQDEYAARNHELVAFDVNRTLDTQPLLQIAPLTRARAIIEKPERSFVFTLLTNQSQTAPGVVEKRWLPGSANPTIKDTGLHWPQDVYSLSHVALPFAMDDPLYGASPPEALSRRIHLGNSIPRGERGAIRIPPDEILRQRWNPFFPYMEDRMIDWLGLGG
jgi:alpha-beta hydrolase superfamily lysophospholipase